MNKTQKTIIVLLLGTSLFAAGTKRIKDFPDLFEALNRGKRVSVVIHYKDCQLYIDKAPVKKSIDAIGGMKLDTFEYFAPGVVQNEKGYIAASHTILIHHPSYGVVLNYVKIRVFSDNEVKITAQYLTPDTYEVKMDEYFLTTINDGQNNGGAFFYHLE